ncbi:GAF domain-containing protein [Streptomyces sp. NPDC092903]|uniref:GAF domain-containing protein n=1 Tax=Streptomyces sp. NPDC092903 TaxID=3366017 RepID=UPI003812CF8C
MIYDRSSGLKARRPDQDLARRVELIAHLGLGEPAREFDAFAQRLAEEAGEPYAMVNLVTDRQFFVGLHTPKGGDLPAVGREMSLDDGYCPHVVARGLALPLPDVCAHPHFAGNQVVDVLHVRTYTGVPLIHGPTGLIIGSLCVLGPQARPMEEARPRVNLLKVRSADFMKLHAQGAGPWPGTPTRYQSSTSLPE